MKVVDKRAERITFKIDDLKTGSVYEDHDGDIMMWTGEKKMIILASPKDTAQVGCYFTPDHENLYVLLNPVLTLGA